MPSSADARRLWLACGLAALLHLALLFGLRLGSAPVAIPTLEVTLLAMPASSPPLSARVLAPVAQSGGGKRLQPRIPSAREGGPGELAGLVHAADPVLQTDMAAGPVPPRLSTDAPSRQAAVRSDSARTGAGTALLLPRRERSGDPSRGEPSASAPVSDDGRRADAGLSTRASREAAYRELWRRRVERAGAANFPWSALAMGQPKSLTLLVTLRADGSVSQARVLRSSGLPMLDRAALDILRLAGPFPPFPDDLRRDTQTLSFAYDWEFLPGDRARLHVGN
ncbi:MAG TPA: TonB family protein [Nevskiales bacterium]|nr:TonB family protein [Nevskiales bacterium]